MVGPFRRDKVKSFVSNEAASRRGIKEGPSYTKKKSGLRRERTENFLGLENSVAKKIASRERKKIRLQQPALMH